MTTKASTPRVREKGYGTFWASITQNSNGPVELLASQSSKEGRDLLCLTGRQVKALKKLLEEWK